MRVEESQLEDVTAPAKGIVVRRSWQKHVLTFLMVFGPGLIVMEADKIAMTRPVRISLGILRAYLIVMTLMLGYHVLDLAGVFHAIRGFEHMHGGGKIDSPGKNEPPHRRRQAAPRRGVGHGLTPSARAGDLRPGRASFRNKLSDKWMPA